MALASSFNVSLVRRQSPNRLSLTLIPKPPRSIATFARRGNRSIAFTTKRKKEGLRQYVKKEVDEEDSDDPFEVLFRMLEEDLKNLDDDDDDDISPEELEKLDKELEAAIDDSEELMQILSIKDDDVIDGSDDELDLKDWQLKKLADASKAGRRRTNIKTLVAELGLDRNVVLDLLCIPYELLLSMSTNSSSSIQNQKSHAVLEAEYEVLGDAPELSPKLEAKSELAVKATKTKRSSQKNRKNTPH